MVDEIGTKSEKEGGENAVKKNDVTHRKYFYI